MHHWAVPAGGLVYTKDRSIGGGGGRVGICNVGTEQTAGGLRPREGATPALRTWTDLPPGWRVCAIMLNIELGFFLCCRVQKITLKTRHRMTCNQNHRITFVLFALSVNIIPTYALLPFIRVSSVFLLSIEKDGTKNVGMSSFFICF